MTSTEYANPDAAALYFSLTDAAALFASMLHSNPAPLDRARALDGLALLEGTMTALHRTAFGRDVDDEGRDLASSVAQSGYLAGAMASVERAIADGRPRVPGDNLLDEAMNPILDRIIAAGGLDRQLRDELYAAVEPLVGSQAAETIGRLPLRAQA